MKTSNVATRNQRLRIRKPTTDIAGPNGAGKTTFAREFLPREAECPDFINADPIAVGKDAAVTGRGTPIAYKWRSPQKASQSDRADPCSRQGPNTI
jgi:hypothetical protein